MEGGVKKPAKNLKVVPFMAGRGQRDQRDMLKSFAKRVVDHDFVSVVIVGIHHDGAVTSSYTAPSNKNLLGLLGGMDIIQHTMRRYYLER